MEFRSSKTLRERVERVRSRMASAKRAGDMGVCELLILVMWIFCRVDEEGVVSIERLGVEEDFDLIFMEGFLSSSEGLP